MHRYVEIATSAALASLLASLLHIPAHGEVGSPGTDEELTRLRQRVVQLEAENRELREALASSQESNDELSVEREKLQVLAGLPTAGRGDALLVASYDASANITQVGARPMLIPESASGLGVRHSLSAGYRFEGEAPAAPITEGSIIITTAGNTNNRYKQLEVVTFSAAGEDYPLEVKAYEITRDLRTGSGRTKLRRYDERITLEVDYPTLRRLSRSAPLRLELGRNEFGLEPGHEALLAGIAKRMEQSGAK